MTDSTFNDESGDVSARTGFSGNQLIRDSEHRTDDTLRMALDDPRATVYLAQDGHWLARGEERPDPHFPVRDLARQPGSWEAAVLLGTDRDGSPRLAMPADGLPDGPSAGLTRTDLRSAAMQGLFDRNTEGQLAQAAHLLGWHERNRFCGRCGGETVSEAAGYRRRCIRCDEVVFPRTDPVSIMLVHDGNGHCVLGRQPRFAERFWSCLAGFVEPGETIEDAVRRETLEEAGITVGPVRYLASQPWPFPGNLMIGCIGLATSFEIEFDGVELEACRWFDRDEVRSMLEGSHPDGLTVPRPYAIAHHLIRAFAEGGAAD